MTDAAPTARMLGRALLLGIVCAAVYFSLSIPFEIKRRIIERLNTTSIVITVETDRWGRGDLSPRTGRLAGRTFTGQCFERRRAAEDLLSLEPSPTAGPVLFCRIETGLGREQASSWTPAIIESMRFPASWRVERHGWRDGWLGRPGLAENVVALVEASVWMLVFCLLFDVRQDWVHARELLRTRPSWIYLPSIAKIPGLLLGDGLGRLLLSIDRATAFVGGMIHAPISEEILFRALYFTLVARFSNAWFAALYVSAVFALDHGYTVVGTVGAFFSALALQYLYVRFGSILVCVLAHMFINGVGLLATAAAGTP